MNKIKLVMSDLDETLLKSHKDISEADLAMINKLIEAEVMLIPTTGRHHTGIPEYFFENDDIRYLISSNGAQIFDKETQEVIYETHLEKSVAKEVIALANDKATFIGVVSNGVMVIDGRIKDDVERRDNLFFTRVIEAGNVVDDIMTYVDELSTPILKINLAFKDLEFRDDFYENMKRKEHINAEASSLSNVEITHADTSKGAALDFMLEHLNLKREEVMAIGDNDNDITMIQRAGLGVAMGNASDNVKSHSDAVTLDVLDDGFAHAIQNTFKF